MRIAFVNPPSLPEGSVEAEDCCWGVKRHTIIPAQLLACATEARIAGHDVSFRDLTIEIPLSFPWKPDLIVYPLAWPYHKPVFEAMTKVLPPDVPFVILAIPPGYAEDYERLTPSPLAILYSEPEMTMQVLPRDAVNLIDCTDYTNWKPPYLSSSFDELNPIDWSIIPAYYWPHYTVAVYQVTRGCSYRCKFCVWGGSTVTDREERRRPEKQVADDLCSLREYAQDNGCRQLPILYLLASQLTTDIDWVREFSEAMSPDPYPFTSNFNVAELTAEKVRLLVAAGMETWTAGIEALTNRTLRMLGKPFKFETILKNLPLLENSPAKTYKVHLLMGYGETEADVEESIENLHRLHAAGIRRVRMNIHPVTFYKGTIWGDNPPVSDFRINDNGEREWANPPQNWIKFSMELGRLGYLTRAGLNGCGEEFVRRYIEMRRGR